MKEERLLVTMKDPQRYRILMDYLKKRLTATQASQMLGLSYSILEAQEKSCPGWPEGSFKAA